MSIKTVCIQTAPEVKMTVLISEYYESSDLTIFVWTAAYVLAAYIATSQEFIGKSILELGAGAGLPSITAACCGSKRVVLTDRNEPVILEILNTNIALNSVQDRCTAVRCTLNMFIYVTPY
jgi:predicted nicotinamide N-methyase